MSRVKRTPSPTAPHAVLTGSNGTMGFSDEVIRAPLKPGTVLIDAEDPADPLVGIDAKG